MEQDGIAVLCDPEKLDSRLASARERALFHLNRLETEAVTIGVEAGRDGRPRPGLVLLRVVLLEVRHVLAQFLEHLALERAFWLARRQLASRTMLGAGQALRRRRCECFQTPLLGRARRRGDVGASGRRRPAEHAFLRENRGRHCEIGDHRCKYCRGLEDREAVSTASRHKASVGVDVVVFCGPDRAGQWGPLLDA